MIKYSLKENKMTRLMMLVFVLVIEGAGFKKPAFPLIVVGMNSIFIYSAGFLVKDSIDRWVMAFSGGFEFVGPLAPVAQACAVMLVLWTLCYWLYRHRIFLKV